MPRGAATKKGRGGQADRGDRPSVLASQEGSGVPDQPARRQQGSRRGKVRSVSSVSDQETSSVTEGSCQLSRHERMEKGLTRLGKKANDRPEAVTWEESEKDNEQGDNTTITALLPSSSGPPTPTPTAQVRLSDLLSSDSIGDSPAAQHDGGLTPADSLSTSVLPCRTSPAPASLRSSFQTARGTPTPTSTGSRRSRRSRGEKAHEEEEERVISPKNRADEISAPAGGNREGAGSESASISIDISQLPSDGVRKGGTAPVKNGGETRKKRGKRVRSESKAAEEKERVEGESREGEDGKEEERAGEKEEEREAERNASEEDEGESDSDGGESEENDGDDGTTSGSATPPSPARTNQRLRRGIHCKVEFDR